MVKKKKAKMVAIIAQQSFDRILTCFQHGLWVSFDVLECII